MRNVEVLNGSDVNMFFFKADRVISEDLKIALMVAMGIEFAPERNNVKDLDAEAELFMLKTIIDYNKTDNFDKKMLIIDITNFPMIGCYIDERDQTVVMGDSDDDFSRDVIQAWSNTPKGTVATICVNLHIHYTALKLIKI